MKNITASILAIAILSTVTVQAAPSVSPTLQRVIEIRKTLPVPADWHFFMSNEAEWRDAARPTHSAYSNLAYKSTFIREWYAMSATDEQLRHTIAHEMGHRICNCTDEATAEGIALQILK